ncbi:MAG TPA: MerR family DNA-binding transcriptional regulator [Candidatus Limnocylindria bacterium]|nr:MerR family DNA-binding transcriptional regulator [Candidatus Limnocylindria bacterium]
MADGGRRRTRDERRTADPDDPWLPIGAASRLVGVGADTLRRWADAGTVQSYQTAGGHRRFLRSSLETITTSPRRPRYATGQLTDAAPTIVGDVHRRVQRTGYAGMPWQSRLTAEQRADFRRWGQRTFNLVIEYVAAARRSERQLLLEEAEKMGALYGTEALAAGLTLAEAIEAFLYYRSPVLESILAHLRRRAAEVSQVTAAVREANAAIDQVLVALVGSYQGRARGGPAPVTRRRAARGSTG